MKKLNFLSIFSVGYREISFSYRPRIKPVLFPYQSRIVLKNTVLAVCDECLLKDFLTIRQEFTPPI